MLYCKQSTVNHSIIKIYPEILEQISVILRREGCNLTPSPFEDTSFPVINGDKLEEVKAKAEARNKNKSADIIFAIDDGEVIMQMIELKLRTTSNFTYFDKFSLRGKMDSTSLALDSSIKLSKKYYIVFKSNVLNQARRYLFRQNPRLDNDFKAIDVNGLFDLFFS